jgi:glycosyltransferase involved in cell wall biosynthesis
MNPEISIVVPLYNEEKVFTLLIDRLKNLIRSAGFSVEIILVDDGSIDTTPFLIEEIVNTDEHFTGILLSKNHGHQLAISAGLSLVKCTEAAMIIDGDLQDPPELIFDFYQKIKEGFDVVYAVRRNRKESFLKKKAYWAYYRLQQKISNIQIPLDSGDFSMLSRKVVDCINAMPEQSRYIRGMRSWVGFKQHGYLYDRDPRASGETKYSWGKLFELAFNGIFNFSDFPVRFISRLGITTILISLIYLLYVVIQKIIFGNVPAGFTTLIIAIVLFSGVQLISIGLIGEYVLRIYNQVRNRPLFIIDRIITSRKEKE